MQNIIIEKPYHFIPPHRGTWIPSLVQRFRLVDFYLNRFEGIESFEIRGENLLAESISAGHGVILTPNHCRYADPVAVGWLARKVNVHLFAMASWHLFHQNWWMSQAIRLCGGFSVYREGIDRQSLETAINAVTEAERPLVLFPEGAVFRTNDLLAPLLEGVSFLARNAAKRRHKTLDGRVVIHPIAIKYLYKGDIVCGLNPIISSLEQRLGWTPRDEPILRRVERLRDAVLVLAEMEYFLHPQSGTEKLRRENLIEHLLRPLETKLFEKTSEQPLVVRIKNLRMKLVPELISNDCSASKKAEIRRALALIYQAQQIGSYPPDYLEFPSEMRVIETLERIEEDLTGQCTTHRPLHAVIEVGKAVDVPHERQPRGEPDALLETLQDRLQEMLTQLAPLSPPLP